MVSQRRTRFLQARPGRLALLFLALAALTLSRSSALGQLPTDDITYRREMLFRIPFEPESGERMLREVRLHLSVDQGRTWRHYQTAMPERRSFDFRADRDGQYWFAVQTVDTAGRVYPQILDGTRPGLKLCVDTQPPSAVLRPLPGREGLVGVEWDVRDPNLDLPSLRLEYRLPSAVAWQPLTIEPAATGQRFWNPGINGAIEARVAVYDKAGNLGGTTIPLNSSGASGFGNPAPEPGSPPSQNPAGPVDMVNSKRININYEITDAGPSGVSAIELWLTQDGRAWQRIKEEQNPQRPMVVDVSGEGLYGFTLVVISGVGLLEKRPQSGDQPQKWVKVDLTKPKVSLNGVDVGRGVDSGKMFITWTASDDNLLQQPITLSYAQKPEGPTWVPIVSNYENTGRYVWSMPVDVPYQLFVRVAAADKAGNMSSAETPQVIKVDLALPRAVIKGLEAATK